MHDNGPHPADPNEPLLDPRTLSLADLARAIADGELAAEDVARIDPSSDPLLAARVDFERTLRVGVRRVMDEPASAPEAVAARVRGVLAAEAREREPRTLPLRAFETVSSRRWLSRWAGLAAAAAIAAAGVYFGYQSVHRAGWLGPPTAIELASFIRREHAECAKFEDHFNSKFVERRQEHAEEAAVRILGALPPVVKLPVAGLETGGYRFMGIGPCAVPGRGDSAHLLFADGEHAGARTISLFVQVDTDQLALQPDASYTCPSSGASSSSPVIWRQGGFIYYLFADDPRSLRVAEEALRTPAVERRMG